MRKILILLLFLFVPTLFYSQDFSEQALTPPMGLSSRDCFGPTVNEDKVKANADYMSQYILKYGWEYIVVDIRWYVENTKAHGYNEEYPVFVLDDCGRFLPAVNMFSSASKGKGFKPLADYEHDYELLA